ncbi:hypothetical protein BD310DRAFT_981971 [Dichomitus squalens]|uniref:Uncharacterized protein n=1 Tax=Dichomitus squalens TaxID=114155 RepID=A0A4Q9PBX6_9APHY|nr:hypothetical protein BD310DRAFT_981971 [Dichomitus squalens]
MDSFNNNQLVDPMLDFDAAIADLQNYIHQSGHPQAVSNFSHLAPAVPPPPYAPAVPVPFRDIRPIPNAPSAAHWQSGDGQGHTVLPYTTVDAGDSDFLEYINENIPPPSEMNGAPYVEKVAPVPAAPAVPSEPEIPATFRGKRVPLKAQDAPAVASAPKAKGKGSRSGKLNRREPGASDNEIDTLGEPEKELAKPPKSTGLTAEEKVAMVKYVTDPTRWAKFKVKQGTYWKDECHANDDILSSDVCDQERLPSEVISNTE